MISSSVNSSVTMSSDIELPVFFDRNPELKAKLQDYLRSVPEAQKRENVELFRKFLTGELTWAEVKKIPKPLLKELARVGYQRLLQKDYRGAEVLFKGLAIIDHNNWYYRAALGAVFRQEGHWEQAIEEFSIALNLRPDEVTCLVNRGECYLHGKNFDAALEDFIAVTNSDLPKESPWRKRAEVLSRKIVEHQAKG
jgi:tetratricopeptide (TPR) repeat protein